MNSRPRDEGWTTIVEILRNAFLTPLGDSTRDLAIYAAEIRYRHAKAGCVLATTTINGQSWIAKIWIRSTWRGRRFDRSFGKLGRISDF